MQINFFGTGIAYVITSATCLRYFFSWSWDFMATRNRVFIFILTVQYRSRTVIISMDTMLRVNSEIQRRWCYLEQFKYWCLRYPISTAWNGCLWLLQSCPSPTPPSDWDSELHKLLVLGLYLCISISSSIKFMWSDFAMQEFQEMEWFWGALMGYQHQPLLRSSGWFFKHLETLHLPIHSPWLFSTYRYVLIREKVEKNQMLIALCD